MRHVRLKRASNREEKKPARIDQAKPARPSATPLALRSPGDVLRSPGDVLRLQQTVGNRAVQRLLAQQREEAPPPPATMPATPGKSTVALRPTLQRYTLTQNYTYAAGPSPLGAVGTALFQSQELRDPGGGAAKQHTRSETHIGHGGLTQQGQQYDPVGQTWNGAGPAAAVANQPEIKVSKNARLAIENTGQPRVFFIDPALLGESNESLAGKNSAVRIRPTNGPSLTVQGNTLIQAQVEQAANPGQLVRLADNTCDKVAGYVIGANVSTTSHPETWKDKAPLLKKLYQDRDAKPGAGQGYFFKSKGDESSLSAPAPDQADLAQQLTQLLQEVDALQADLNQGIDDAYEQYMSLAANLVPGWGEHFEGVIATDGDDRITFVNFNRNVELRWEKRRLFGQLYQANAAFAQAFRQKIAAARAQKGDINWLDIIMRMDPLAADLQAHLNVAQQNTVAQARALEATVNQQKNAMWYFDMYGPKEQSFHAKYEPYARGGASKTRTIG